MSMVYSFNLLPAGLLLLLIIGLIAVVRAGTVQGKGWQRRLNIGVPLGVTFLALLLLGNYLRFEDLASPTIEGIILITSFLLLLLAGFAAPRCFWLTALGITAGFIISNIATVMQPGYQSTGYDAPPIIVAIGLLMILPVVFGAVGGGALLRKIVQHFRARRRQNITPK